jgi:hypothetical protein
MVWYSGTEVVSATLHISVRIFDGVDSCTLLRHGGVLLMETEGSLASLRDRVLFYRYCSRMFPAALDSMAVLEEHRYTYILVKESNNHQPGYHLMNYGCHRYCHPTTLSSVDDK